MSTLDIGEVTALFPDELVTRSVVRYVELPAVDGRVVGAGAAGELALVTLDNGMDHTKPSTFGPAGLASLSAALDEIEARTPAVAAIAVTGKPFVFAVGADLKGAARIASRDQALRIGRAGHQVYRRLVESPVPTFAFVNGAVLGGGLELALACRYRTLSGSTAAIAFPECFLGLVPGWGGCTLLPKLIGAERAIAVIVDNALAQNKMLSPRQAAELGIVDVLLEPADFLEESLRWAARVLAGETIVARPAVDTSTQTWDGAVARGRAGLAARLHGAAPAPVAALDLIAAARTNTVAEGFAAEDEVLADLLASAELRAGLYSFDLTQRRARRPVGAPPKELARPVTKVGVVGAGLMASQLALLFARRLEVPVVLTDLDQARLDRGVSYAHGEVDKLAGKGRVGPDQASRLKSLVTGSLSKDAFADADLVIEAVFEDMKVKKQVFAEVEAVVSAECLLATNTSSLSVGEMAADLAHPERVVGLHFFNPVAVLPLLEVVRSEQTDDATLATAFAVGKKLKKSCVLVKDAPAFVVNRLLTRFLGEVLRALDEGTDFAEADEALDPLGLPMRPLVLLALVGPAVALHVAETLHEAYPDRFATSAKLRQVVELGKASIYQWDTGSPVLDPDIAAVYGPRGGGPSGAELRERALAALAEEARLMLDEGVVAEAQDIDLCMILGAGWPFHLGGITPYLDRTGVAERVTGRRFLPPGVASLPHA
ncbi:MAG TPA: 3-hydroxyacyl-CoA dehydrogenase NAD-binding domain-containing protein [Mycobacteriales bacterium]|nr:3-hydroxyacyl-CoA dehydrogenase NAD-binding domain-containing protein [Mycobacteriales bacterium]